jgi:glycine/D-amino acid oxidase-like deaminating enzyme
MLRQRAVVIGAGAVGAAAAYFLSQEGWAVRVLEASGVAAGASGAAEGIVGSVAKRKSGPVTDIVRRSFVLFPQLEEALGYPIEYVRKPGLMIVHDRDDAALLQAFVKKRIPEGIAIEWLDSAQSREIEPALGGDVAGSVCTPEQGIVNPIQLAHGFLRAAKRVGGSLHCNESVTGFRTQGDRISAVVTTTATYEADLVVNAAGTGAQAIGAMVGDAVAISPKRAQMIVSEAQKPGSLRNTLYSGAVVAAGINRKTLDFEDVPAEANQVDAEASNKWQLSSLTQTARGNVLFCGGFGFAGDDRRAQPEIAQAIAANVSELLPHYAHQHLRIIRAWAELEPCTPDNLPVLRYAEGCCNLIHAAGFGNAGIMMSPCAGQLVADLAMQRSDDPVLISLLQHYNGRRVIGTTSDTSIAVATPGRMH